MQKRALFFFLLFASTLAPAAETALTVVKRPGVLTRVARVCRALLSVKSPKPPKEITAEEARKRLLVRAEPLAKWNIARSYILGAEPALRGYVPAPVLSGAENSGENPLDSLAGAEGALVTLRFYDRDDFLLPAILVNREKAEFWVLAYEERTMQARKVFLDASKIEKVAKGWHVLPQTMDFVLPQPIDIEGRKDALVVLNVREDGRLDVAVGARKKKKTLEAIEVFNMGASWRWDNNPFILKTRKELLARRDLYARPGGSMDIQTGQDGKVPWVRLTVLHEKTRDFGFLKSLLSFEGADPLSLLSCLRVFGAYYDVDMEITPSHVRLELKQSHFQRGSEVEGAFASCGLSPSSYAKHEKFEALRLPVGAF